MSFPLSMHFGVVHRLQSSPFLLSQPANDASHTSRLPRTRVVRWLGEKKRDCFAVCVVQHFLTPILQTRIYPDGRLLRTARVCRIKIRRWARAGLPNSHVLHPDNSPLTPGARKSQSEQRLHLLGLAFCSYRNAGSPVFNLQSDRATVTTLLRCKQYAINSGVALVLACIALLPVFQPLTHCSFLLAATVCDRGFPTFEPMM